jgi:hypothetical protein
MLLLAVMAIVESVPVATGRLHNRSSRTVALWQASKVCNIINTVPSVTLKRQTRRPEIL